MYEHSRKLITDSHSVIVWAVRVKRRSNSGRFNSTSALIYAVYFKTLTNPRHLFVYLLLCLYIHKTLLSLRARGKVFT
jgi:hypothetical protein